MAETNGTLSKFTNTDVTVRETIDTGDGIQTVFGPYTVDHPTDFIDSLTIEYVIGTTTYQGTSDTAGTITGTNISSGTFTEAGVINVTFSTAPDDLSLIETVSYTAKGFMEKLLEFVSPDQYTELVGTGDGIQTTFGTTLTNTTVAKGQCRIKFKIAGSVYDIFDDGQGSFLSEKISASSIVYATGVMSFTTTDPVDDLYAINAFYTDGAEGQDWLQMMNQLSQTKLGADAYPGLDLREIVFKNSGPSFKEDIFVGLREYQYVPSNYYGLQFNVYTNWRQAEEVALDWNISSGESGHGRTGYSTTFNSWTLHPTTPFNDDDMEYWIFSNKRRIIGLIKVSGTIYTCFYVGQGKRYSSSDRYPQPTIVIGNAVGAIAFSSISANYSFIIDPPGTVINSFFQLPDRNWSDTASADARFLPMAEFVNTGVMKKTDTNEVLLYPVIVMDKTPPAVIDQQVLFELDGVFHSPYFNLAAEDLIQYSGDDYLVIQNIFRTDYFDFMAIKKE